jgi:predicted RNA-binding Zn-ribbon protein involved in translation (DUF1610 family)
MEPITINDIVKSDTSSITKDSCPKCGHNHLIRIKRKTVHKLLSVTLLGVVDTKRYACERCEWKGIKLGQMKK